MRRRYLGLALAAMATVSTNPLGPMSLEPGQALGGDREIAEAIIAKLKADRDSGDLKDFNLDMKVDQGVVLFRGQVAGEAQRDLVLAASTGVDGVQDVVNELTLSDSEMATALASEPVDFDASSEQSVESQPVAATTKIIKPRAQVLAPASRTEGVAGNQANEFDFSRALSQLSVPSPNANEIESVDPTSTAERMAAAQAVPSIGNKVAEQVDNTAEPNQLAANEPAATQAPVAPESSVTRPAAAWETDAPAVEPVAAIDDADIPDSDAELTRMIAGAIGKAKSMGHLKSFGVDVNVYEGIVELVGKADSVDHRNLIGKIAGGAPGVRGVRNLIEITTPTSKTSKAVSAQTVAHRTPAPMPSLPAARPMAAARPTAQPLVDQQPVMVPQPTTVSQPMAPVASMPMAPSRMPTHFASYGNQMINGEMVVPGSIVNHGPVSGGEVAGAPMMGTPVPMAPSAPVGAPRYDSPQLPNYAWPGYAAYPNYAALSYPQQYSPAAFPYIGPFYPYPQVPLGWRKVSLEWDDGWWFLDFTDR